MTTLNVQKTNEKKENNEKTNDKKENSTRGCLKSNFNMKLSQENKRRWFREDQKLDRRRICEEKRNLNLTNTNIKIENTKIEQLTGSESLLELKKKSEDKLHFEGNALQKLLKRVPKEVPVELLVLIWSKKVDQSNSHEFTFLDDVMKLCEWSQFDSLLKTNFWDFMKNNFLLKILQTPDFGGLSHQKRNIFTCKILLCLMNVTNEKTTEFNFDKLKLIFNLCDHCFESTKIEYYVGGNQEAVLKLATFLLEKAAKHLKMSQFILTTNSKTNSVNSVDYFFKENEKEKQNEKDNKNEKKEIDFNALSDSIEIYHDYLIFLLSLFPCAIKKPTMAKFVQNQITNLIALYKFSNHLFNNLNNFNLNNLNSFNVNDGIKRVTTKLNECERIFLNIFQHILKKFTMDEKFQEAFQKIQFELLNQVEPVFKADNSQNAPPAYILLQEIHPSVFLQHPSLFYNVNHWAINWFVDDIKSLFSDSNNSNNSNNSNIESSNLPDFNFNFNFENKNFMKENFKNENFENEKEKENDISMDSNKNSNKNSNKKLAVNEDKQIQLEALNDVINTFKSPFSFLTQKKTDINQLILKKYESQYYSSATLQLWSNILFLQSDQVQDILLKDSSLKTKMENLKNLMFVIHVLDSIWFYFVSNSNIFKKVAAENGIILLEPTVNALKKINNAIMTCKIYTSEDDRLDDQEEKLNLGKFISSVVEFNNQFYKRSIEPIFLSFKNFSKK